MGKAKKIRKAKMRNKKLKNAFRLVAAGYFSSMLHGTCLTPYIKKPSFGIGT